MNIMFIITPFNFPPSQPRRVFVVDEWSKVIRQCLVRPHLARVRFFVRRRTMQRSIDKTFYNSKRWKDCRDAYLASKNHLCERCKAKGLYEPARVVHHKIYLTKENVNDPSISLNFDNLEALCQDCHNNEHFGDHDKRYKVDEQGRLIF